MVYCQVCKDEGGCGICYDRPITAPLKPIVAAKDKVVMPRKLHEIAVEAAKDMATARPDLPQIKAIKARYPAAWPYLDAMATLDSIQDKYYLDTGRSIVLYFLANAGTWRGETARRIKKELNEILGK